MEPTPSRTEGKEELFASDDVVEDGYGGMISDDKNTANEMTGF